MAVARVVGAHKQGIKNRMATGLNKLDIEDLRNKYKDIQGIQIKNLYTDKWEWVRIIGRYKDFIVVQATNYQTGIQWVDILTGHTPVREG